MSNATDNRGITPELCVFLHVFAARDCAARMAVLRRDERIAWHVERAREAVARPDTRRIAA